MELKIGNNIKRLRREKDVTQEDFAELLGVSSQSVSRWENGVCYPDMELIPAIANYFGVSVDELFGCQYDREKRIEAIIAKVDAMDIGHDGDDGWVDEAVAILREGIAEFPGNEQLLITMAETLWEAGWRRQGDFGGYGEYGGYGEDGYIRYCYDKARKNEYWSECAKICEQLIENGRDNTVYMRALAVIVPLYRNYGDYEKAISYANRMPDLQKCRDYLLSEATDGKLNARYAGEFLLRTAKEFTEQLIFNLIDDLHNFETDVPIQKVAGAIDVFKLICDDGNMGEYHDFVSKLYLYLSRLQWERGFHDEAFVSLDEALRHAKAYEKIADGKEHALTAPLVSFVRYTVKADYGIVKQLPEEWPFWCNPYYREIAQEIKADPRWDAWVKKTQEA